MKSFKQIIVGALVMFGNGVSSISGKIDGTVFTRNASGAVAKGWKKPTNPQTSAQQLARQIFSSVSAAWRTLSQGDRQGWTDGAVNFPYVNRLGQTQLYTGQQLYNKFNGNLMQIGEPGITACPAVADIATMEDPTPTATLSTGEILIGTNAVSNVPANQFIRVFASAPVSQGKNNMSGLTLRLIKVFAPAAAFKTEDIAVEYEAIFGTSWQVEGVKIMFKFDSVVDASGQNGPPVKVRTIVVA